MRNGMTECIIFDLAELGASEIDIADALRKRGVFISTDRVIEILGGRKAMIADRKAAAQTALRREISLAKHEARKAKPYKGGWLYA